MATAFELKEQGNECFKSGNFKDAERFYSLAIQKDPSNVKLFTNRAFARVKLQAWEGCLDDCLKAIEIDTANMKAYFYLAQAQLGLHRPNEALSSALRAYELTAGTHGNNAGTIVQVVLQAKKLKWEHRERERIRRQDSMLKELSEGLESIRDAQLVGIEARHQRGEIGNVEAVEESCEIQELTKQKLLDMERVFAASDPKLEKREVPDWMIDDISFSIMVDPVITKTGHSYERATILEHLRRSCTDPMTREPLFEHELRPNLALKQACEEFLEKNGWAVDY